MPVVGMVMISEEEIKDIIDEVHASRAVLDQVLRLYDEGALTKHEVCLEICEKADRLELSTLRDVSSRIDFKELLLHWLRDVGAGAAVGSSSGVIEVRASSRIAAALFYNALKGDF